MRDFALATGEGSWVAAGVGRQSIVNALTEAKGTPAKRSWDKLKKSELAVLAEREIAGSGWLPQLLKA